MTHHPVDPYGSLLRPLLFRLSPDRAHDLAHAALHWPAVWRLLGSATRRVDRRLETSLGGLRLSSPVGLAPGFDKTTASLPSLAQLGFGYVVVGSVTREPRAGNPRPRLQRYPDRLSLANCMGMPNPGLAEVVRRLRALPPRPTPVLVSVAGFSSDELLAAAAAVEPYVAGVEIGLVCRHTPETGRMQDLDVFEALAEGLARQKRKPTFVKLPPHHTPRERERTLAMVDLCLQYGLDGVSVSGTRQVLEPRLSTGSGGLAGRATTADALRILEDVAARAAGRLAIKAAGGVFTGQDAYRMLRAGATAVELYSAFIYRGPFVASQINRELVAILEREDLPSIQALQRSAPAALSSPSPVLAAH